MSSAPRDAVTRLKSAVHAMCFHFLGSALVALCVATVVFFVWYPWPFYEIVRGRELFWLIIGVDVVCGPLLTAVLWNPKKPRREMVLDLGLVVLIQLSALGYGLHVIAEARPIRLVYEVDRFRLVSASEINIEELPLAPEHLQKIPWGGPTLIGTRQSRSGEETLRSIELSLAGQEPSLRPGWWQSYENNRSEVMQRMKPLSALRAVRSAPEQVQIDLAVTKVGLPIGEVDYLPLVSKKSLDDWVVLLDKRADIVGYAPVGGF